MTQEEKLYETLGELLYVIAMADGVIQEEEKDALKTLLKNHSWAENIQWSFSYEEGKYSNVDEVYRKVLDTCFQTGPHAVYEEFISAMETVAEASNGIDAKEDGVIKSFSNTLIAKFRADIEKLNS